MTERESVITDSPSFELLPYDRSAEISTTVPGGHPIADIINYKLSTLQDVVGYSAAYNTQLKGDSAGLSMYIILGMREYCEAALEERAIGALDVGLRWPRSLVNGASYEEVAVSAVQHRKFDLAYELALDEARLTSGAGMPRTLEDTLRAGRSPAKITEYALGWLQRSSAIYTKINKFGGNSTKEWEYKERVQVFLELLESLAESHGALPTKNHSVNGVPVVYTHMESLRACHENFTASGAREWADRIERLALGLDDLQVQAEAAADTAVESDGDDDAATHSGRTNASSKEHPLSSGAEATRLLGRLASMSRSRFGTTLGDVKEE